MDDIQISDYINAVAGYNKIVKEHYGYEGVKMEQGKIVYELIENKRDVLAILSTGYGKSLIFQLVHLATQKTVFVVSPLLSLINDQTTDAVGIGIVVGKINSECSREEIDMTKRKLSEGIPMLIYTTPEWIEKELKKEEMSLLNELDERKLMSLIVVDEAHCISSWSNFRASYLKLDKVREHNIGVPILALTATAPSNVREDIVEKLKLNNPIIIIGDFDRPNLFIGFIKKQKQIKRKKSDPPKSLVQMDVIYDIVDKINRFPNDQHIVYCKKRDMTELVADELKKLGIRAVFYHADVETNIKNKIQQDVVENKINCVVATTAYGQGINTPNVRCVFHYTPSKNIENYYQEIGRAGRDGLPSFCYMYYDANDFNNHRFNVKDLPKVEKDYLTKQIERMENLVFSNECRKKSVLNHFEQKTLTNCGNCDRCVSGMVDVRENYIYQVYLFLSLLTKLDGKRGCALVISILRGQKLKTIDDEMKRCEEYGAGKTTSEAKWKEIVQFMKGKDFIKTTSSATKSFVTSTCITATGRALIRKFKEKYPTYPDLMNADTVEELY